MTELPDQPSPSLHVLWAALLAFGGFLPGVGLLSIGATRDAASSVFAHSPSGRLWIGLIGAQSAFWAVSALPLLGAVLGFRRRFPEELEGVGVRTVLFVVVFGGVVYAAQRVVGFPDVNPLLGHAWKTTLLTIAAAVTVGRQPSLGCSWSTRRADLSCVGVAARATSTPTWTRGRTFSASCGSSGP